LENPGAVPLERILQAYEHYNLGPDDDVVINGGEPTLYPRLETIIHEAIARGAKVVLFTNGRLLRYFDRAKTWLSTGIHRVSIPLHGSRAETHDALTKRTGSFEQTIQGIRNTFSLRKEFGYPYEIELKVLAIKDSLPEWPEIIDLIFRNFGVPDILVMSGLNMWSTARDSYKNLAPTISPMQIFINEALRHASTYHFPVSLWAIPFCLLNSENLEKFVASRQKMKTSPPKRVVYFDPLCLEGIEYPDEEFYPRNEVEPVCRECHLAEICGPGRVFFQQLLALSSEK
jgi:MoaA/NifB/PqqE/SkfB family radical SAM enzyme